MSKIKQKQQKIIQILLSGEILSSSNIYKKLADTGEDVSLVTVKRILTQLVNDGSLNKSGAGRTTSYVVSTKGRVLADVNAKEYCAIDPDKRLGLK